MIRGRPGILERLGHGRWAYGALCNTVLAFWLSGCRIYRDDGGTGGAPAAVPASAGQAPTAAVEKPEPTPSATDPSQAQPPPAEALSLWVLNRPATELVARGPEQPEMPAGEVVSTPRASALVALGLGPPHVCAELFARRALRYASNSVDPLQAVMAVLEDVRRWRWPDAATLNATVKASDGRFGAIQSVPAGLFSSSLLAAAIQRGAVLDGQNARWHEHGLAPLEGPLDAHGADARCESVPGAELHGPAGILLQTEGDKYFGGLLDLESPADAGVISVVSQYGVSVAVGPSGGVLLLSDCMTLPHEALAATVYAGLAEGAPAPGQGAGEPCQRSHAVLSGWAPSVTGSGPLAWASAVDREWVRAPEPPKTEPPFSVGDAGATDTGTSRQP